MGHGCCMAKTSTDEREAFLDNENEERQSTLRHNVVVDWEEDTNLIPVNQALWERV